MKGLLRFRKYIGLHICFTAVEDANDSNADIISNEVLANRDVCRHDSYLHFPTQLRLDYLLFLECSLFSLNLIPGANIATISPSSLLKQAILTLLL